MYKATIKIKSQSKHNLYSYKRLSATTTQQDKWIPTSFATAADKKQIHTRRKGEIFSSAVLAGEEMVDIDTFCTQSGLDRDLILEFEIDKM